MERYEDMEGREIGNGAPMGYVRRDLAGALGALGLAWLFALAGCGKDCREAVRLGDFEYSQGNYANAAKRYEQALRDDPKCYNVEAKLKDARDRAAGK